jgi:phosphoribosylformylglycinamidine synthase subunit PurL
MTPYEILLSESQERMLVVAKAGHEDDVVRILHKWELEAAVIGHVTDDGLYRVRENGTVVCEMPGEPLVTAARRTRVRHGSPTRCAKLREWTPGAST